MGDWRNMCAVRFPDGREEEHELPYEATGPLVIVSTFTRDYFGRYMPGNLGNVGRVLADGEKLRVTTPEDDRRVLETGEVMRDKDERAKLFTGRVAFVDGRPVSATVTPEADLRAAKERLGAWLAARSCRSHQTFEYPREPGKLAACELHEATMTPDWRMIADESRPTLAEAILAALEKVNA